MSCKGMHDEAVRSLVARVILKPSDVGDARQVRFVLHHTLSSCGWMSRLSHDMRSNVATTAWGENESFPGCFPHYCYFIHQQQTHIQEKV